VATTCSGNIQLAPAQYLHVVLPQWATAHYDPVHGTYFDVIAFLGVIGFAILLTIGVRESAGANAIIVIIKMAVLAFFVLVALPHFVASHFTPFAPNGWYCSDHLKCPAVRNIVPVVGIIPGAFYAFLAFIGCDSVTVAAGDFGPLPVMMSNLLGVAQAGGLDGLLVINGRFYQTNSAVRSFTLAR